jgi:hypothetical protein
MSTLVAARCGEIFGRDAGSKAHSKILPVVVEPPLTVQRVGYVLEAAHSQVETVEFRQLFFRKAYVLVARAFAPDQPHAVFLNLDRAAAHIVVFSVVVHASSRIWVYSNIR